MSSGFGESTNSASCSLEKSSNKDAVDFDCNVCFDLVRDPVVTPCGHLFCWPCLYRWLHHRSRSRGCPVCKAVVEEEKLVPIYGKGKSVTDPRMKSYFGMEIPCRPSAQRPPTVDDDDYDDDDYDDDDDYHDNNDDDEEEEEEEEELVEGEGEEGEAELVEEEREEEELAEEEEEELVAPPPENHSLIHMLLVRFKEDCESTRKCLQECRAAAEQQLKECRAKAEQRIEECCAEYLAEAEQRINDCWAEAEQRIKEYRAEHATDAE
ncbi:hypothetical protein RYX36_003707 [Vicia faba]